MSERAAPVSVVMPAYEAAPTIFAALSSVYAQTVPPSEVIVVDDGSTDGTAELARRVGDRTIVLTQEHAGAAAARNRGIAETTEPFLAHLDADDLWLPDRLEVGLRELDDDPQLDASLGRHEVFYDEGLDDGERARLRQLGGDGAAPLAGTLLIRREAHDRIGGFRPELRPVDFPEWWTRAVDAGLRYRYVDDLMLRRRIHANNTTRVRPDAQYLRMIREHRERRSRSDL